MGRRVSVVFPLAMILGSVLPVASVAGNLKVDSAEDIRQAFGKARPGDTITIKVGEYDMGGELSTGSDGTRGKPITVTADGARGYAHLKAKGQVAFRIRNRFWVFKGIHFEGDYRTTEAAVFMDGPGGCGDIQIIDCRISGSNTHGMKSAKLREKPVNNVLVEHTELFNTGATGFDLPAGDGWILRGNYVHDYGRAGGTSYGIFLKGGGKDGIIEGNIVDGKKMGGTVGISFGGGLMGKQWLRVHPDGTFAAEHENGIARNNIVLNTGDVAYHSNNGRNCRFYNNLAWGCGTFQRQASYPKDPVLDNNLIGGAVKGASENKNTVAPQWDWFVDVEKEDFRLTAAGKAALVGKGNALNDNPTDFFGAKRDRTVPVLGPVLPDASESTKWTDRRK
jgi:hypothetical protein